MKKAKQLAALLLALAMVFAMTACGDTADTPSASQTPAPSQSAGPEESQTPAASADGVVAPITPEELGSGSVKWTETKMSDGWVQVTNEGGETLGYSADSGVSLIQVDGYAFKDLDRDGVLDGYEDWRNDDETRAMDLASQMSVDEMTPLFTHGGWASFGYSIEEGSDDYVYIQNGGRGGVTRSAASSGNTSMAISWVNALQVLCESSGNWGIPATISADPANISNTIDQLSLGATFDTDAAFDLGVKTSRMYRSVGITMLLGPQTDLVTTPILARATGDYTEDPALNRDLTDAYISGLQSTWAEDGTDLGWGEDSLYAIVKHYAGAGAAEGGRNDHFDGGRFDVFPNNNYEAHLIAYFDAAFNLTRSITKASGVMPNYAAAYSTDGSLGAQVGGAYSEYKMGMLLDTGYQGFILTDWQITEDGGAGSYTVEDLTVAERFAALYKNGIHQVGGTTNLEGAAEGFELVEDELGEDEALSILRNAVYHFVLSQMQVGLYENAYVTSDYAFNTVWNNDTDAYALELQKKSVIMLKNSDNTISQSEGTKKTVYIPYQFNTGSAASSSAEATPASWEPAMDLTAVGEYFNVVTDTVGDPSGSDADGNPVYTENDVVRASAADLAGCDMVLVPMSSPITDSSLTDEGIWTPPSIQYEAYTAKTARRESIGGTVSTEIINDGYGTKSQDVKENRSYYGNTAARSSSYGDLEMLQYVESAVPGSCKVVVLMDAKNPMVWSEVEPLADAILLYYGTSMSSGWFFDETLLSIASGEAEPSGLLNLQQPASMEAVEAQAEDTPRDMECYVDADGNTYDFAFGLNWSGVINDERVQKYNVEPLTKVENIDFYYANEK